MGALWEALQKAGAPAISAAGDAPLVVTKPVTKLAPVVTKQTCVTKLSDDKPNVGRPKKYASAAERVAACRERKRAAAKEAKDER